MRCAHELRCLDRGVLCGVKGRILPCCKESEIERMLWCEQRGLHWHSRLAVCACLHSSEGNLRGLPWGQTLLLGGPRTPAKLARGAGMQRVFD